MLEQSVSVHAAIQNNAKYDKVRIAHFLFLLLGSGGAHRVGIVRPERLAAPNSRSRQARVVMRRRIRC